MNIDLIRTTLSSRSLFVYFFLLGSVIFLFIPNARLCTTVSVVLLVFTVLWLERFDSLILIRLERYWIAYSLGLILMVWKAPTKRKLGVRIEHKFAFQMSNNSALVFNSVPAHHYRKISFVLLLPLSPRVHDYIILRGYFIIWPMRANQSHVTHYRHKTK